MKAVAVLCLIGIVCAAAAPAGSNDLRKEAKSVEPNNAKTLRYDNNNKGLGDYNFAFEQSDGTKAEQQGELVNKGSGEFLSVKGSFTFIGPDGVTYTITYTADDNGFKPEIDQGPGEPYPDLLSRQCWDKQLEDI